MFLNDCVKLAQKYYPSEYEAYEMYIWCNEVTALLAAESCGEYTPVKLPMYKGTSEFGENYFTTELFVFETGDAVNISVNGGEKSFSEVPVTEAVYENGLYKLYTSHGIFGDMEKSENTEITRCITDETYCAAPYDMMYTYYILAKICLLQHDIDMYNQYMNLFNTLFDLYKRQLTGGRRKEHTRFTNWWNKERRV